MAVAYIGSDTLTGIRTPLWRTPLLLGITTNQEVAKPELMTA